MNVMTTMFLEQHEYRKFQEIHVVTGSSRQTTVHTHSLNTTDTGRYRLSAPGDKGITYTVTTRKATEQMQIQFIFSKYIYIRGVFF